MAITKIDAPNSIPSAVADYQLQNAHMMGFINQVNNQAIPLSLDGGKPVVKQGSYIAHGGSLYVVNTGDENISGTFNDGDVCWVKLVIDGSNLIASFVKSTSGFSFNHSYGGYYNSGGDQLLPFYIFRSGVAYSVFRYDPTTEGHYVIDDMETKGAGEYIINMTPLTLLVGVTAGGGGGVGGSGSSGNSGSGGNAGGGNGGGSGGSGGGGGGGGGGNVYASTLWHAHEQLNIKVGSGGAGGNDGSGGNATDYNILPIGEYNYDNLQGGKGEGGVGKAGRGYTKRVYDKNIFNLGVILFNIGSGGGGSGYNGGATPAGVNGGGKGGYRAVGGAGAIGCGGGGGGGGSTTGYAGGKGGDGQLNIITVKRIAI